MSFKKDNLISFEDKISDSPYLDYEEDNLFHEWYSIEGAERINELSRQLRTFFNYKQSIIHLRFSKPRNYTEISNKNLITKYERDLITSTSKFIILLKEIGVEDGIIAENLENFMKILKMNPNRANLNLLKDINLYCKKVWNFLHILSEFELSNHKQLLCNIIKISSISCEVNKALYPPFSNFYSMLKINYLQLEKEIFSFLQLRSPDRLTTKVKTNRVRITK